MIEHLQKVRMLDTTHYERSRVAALFKNDQQGNYNGGAEKQPIAWPAELSSVWWGVVNGEQPELGIGGIIVGRYGPVRIDSATLNPPFRPSGSHRM
jgi:hypothetical protein